MNLDGTMLFPKDEEKKNEAHEILVTVQDALKEKGYNAINQIVGYLLSGDPAYITSHRNARNLIRKLERDEILEELTRYYLEGCQNKN